MILSYFDGNVGEKKWATRPKRWDRDTYHWTDETSAKQELSCRRVIQVTECTSDKKGQLLLEPEITIEGWWISLSLPGEKIIALYQDHGTSEQFYGELETDLDLERLPAGDFAVNSLVMTCAARLSTSCAMSVRSV